MISCYGFLVDSFVYRILLSPLISKHFLNNDFNGFYCYKINRFPQMISNCFQIQNTFIKPFNHIRKRNLIKRFNGIEDYDPLLPLFRLIIGLLRLYLFMLIFEWIATTFINIRDEPVVMGHEARLPYLFTCNGFPFP